MATGSEQPQQQQQQTQFQHPALKRPQHLDLAAIPVDASASAYGKSLAVSAMRV